MFKKTREIAVAGLYWSIRSGFSGPYWSIQSGLLNKHFQEKFVLETMDHFLTKYNCWFHTIMDNVVCIYQFRIPYFSSAISKCSLAIKDIIEPIWSNFSYAANNITQEGYNIVRKYWTNFPQPKLRVQQSISEKTVLQVCTSYIHASFGTFCVRIGKLFEAQVAFGECLNIDNSLFFCFENACTSF